MVYDRSRIEEVRLVRTRNALDVRWRTLQALLTQPRALRDVRYSVASLVDGDVTAVAEDDRVRVLTLPVVADAADDLAVVRAVVLQRTVTLEEKGLFLEAIDEVLHVFDGDGREVVEVPATFVGEPQPDDIFFVAVVLDAVTQLNYVLRRKPARIEENIFEERCTLVLHDNLLRPTKFVVMKPIIPSSVHEIYMEMERLTGYQII
jgi:hypothetical protein